MNKHLDCLQRAAGGDPEALGHLLAKHRNRLKRMVMFRLDRRLAARIDPSDVVQESLAQAVKQFDQYAANPTVSFYPWLRQITWQRLIKAHRHHIYTECRTVFREQPTAGEVADDSLAELATCLATAEAGPAQRVIAREMEDRVRAALLLLKSSDREILVLRYLEQLSMREIAEVMGISDSAARQRHLRALHGLQRLLDAEQEGRLR